MTEVPANDFRTRGAIAAVLFVGTLLLFWRAVGHDFVNYDDPDYVSANAHVQAGFNATGLRWAFTSGDASNWHPLTWLSHMLDWSWFGKNPHGHHATSVVLHACNAALAFFAVRRLTGALWTSAACAALFAWHPLRVESVAWIAERKDVLSGFFFFAMLWAYGAYVERKRAAIGGAGRCYALALGMLALGLMAKPMLVTVPCVLLLLDVWPLGRWTPTSPVRPKTEGGREVRAPMAESPAKLLLEKLPFFALAVASSVATYRVQHAGGSVAMTLSLSARLENAVVAIVRYLGKFFCPIDLAVLYPHPGEWPMRKVVASLVIVVAITAFAWAQRRRRPWLAMGWLWFAGMLVPVIGIVQVGLQSMADRYTYLPMLGVQIALLWGVRDFISSASDRRGWAIVACLGAIGLAARTWNQLGVWQDSGTLFDHAIAVTEGNYVAHDNRGEFLYKSGKIDEALADYRAALANNPGYFNANNNYGHALSELGRPAEAVPYFRTALKANPAHLEVHNNLANALSDLGQLDEAMEHYDFVLARQPDHVNALNGSAVVLAMCGKLPDAKARLQKSLALSPENSSAHNNLGNVCSMLGERDEAIAHYRRAAELNPKETHARVLAGALLNQQEKYPEAIQDLQSALALNMNDPEAHAQLGFAFARLGRRDEARHELRIAVQQRPDFAQAQAWLQAIEATK